MRGSVGALIIAVASLSIGYDLMLLLPRTQVSIFMEPGFLYFFCYLLMPLVAFTCSLTGLSYSSEEKKTGPQDVGELEKLKGEVLGLKEKVASMEQVLVEKHILIPNMPTGSGFPAQHTEFLRTAQPTLKRQRRGA